MKKVLILLAMALLLCSAVGCASIVSDNDSTTYIETDPPGAKLTLHGQDFNRVITSPDSIHLPSEAAPITIECEKEGYLTTSVVMDTSMDGWILGNIIFGGVIGAVVDASRGAGQKFPPKFSIQLDPASFQTASARDEYYDSKEKILRENSDAEICKLERRYKKDETRLKRMVNEVEKDRDVELAKLQEHRRTAIIIEQGPIPAIPQPQETPPAAPQPQEAATLDQIKI